MLNYLVSHREVEVLYTRHYAYIVPCAVHVIWSISLLLPKQCITSIYVIQPLNPNSLGFPDIFADSLIAIVHLVTDRQLLLFLLNYDQFST